MGAADSPGEDALLRSQLFEIRRLRLSTDRDPVVTLASHSSGEGSLLRSPFAENWLRLSCDFDSDAVLAA